MTRDAYNAQFEGDEMPEDEIHHKAWDERCEPCLLGIPHTWKRHDAAISLQKPLHGPYAPPSDPEGHVSEAMCKEDRKQGRITIYSLWRKRKPEEESEAEGGQP